MNEAREGGSRTVTTTETQEQIRPVLSLRSAGRTEGDGAQKKKKKSKSKVKWSDDVVDNEFMNKKKTKICCIFHPQKEFGESSSDSSDSSSGSSSSSESEDETGNGHRPRDNDEADCCEHAHTHTHGTGNRDSGKQRQSSPNAYEKQPVYTKKSKDPENA